MSVARSRAITAAAATVMAGLVLGACGVHVAGGAAVTDRTESVARLAADRAPMLPSSMDALGGSFTRGFNTDCPGPFVDCPENSWATGTNPVVDSVYLRLLALNPRLEGHNANDAESGSTMADLDIQAQSAVRHGAELVTIATGTNDACGGRTGTMTEVSVLRDQFDRALDTLTAGLPRVRIHVLSIPDIYQRWQKFHTFPSAVKAWRSIPFCPTLLAHPTSNAPADVNRRAAVRARVLDYNEVLVQVCAQYSRCTTDGGATFRLPVTQATYSTHDYWHPNIAGQAALAELAWETLDY